MLMLHYVSKNAHKADLLHRARLEERNVEALGLHALEQTTEDALEGLRERARAQHGLAERVLMNLRHPLVPQDLLPLPPFKLHVFLILFLHPMNIPP